MKCLFADYVNLRMSEEVNTSLKGIRINNLHVMSAATE